MKIQFTLAAIMVYAVSFIVSLLLLLSSRHTSRGLLFPIACIVSFIIIAIVHSNDPHVGVPADSFDEFGYRNKTMVNINDMPITTQAGFTYYFVGSIVSTSICFGLLAIFIKRENPVGSADVSKEGDNGSRENLTQIITPSGNVFKFSTTDENGVKQSGLYEAKELPTEPLQIIDESIKEKEGKSNSNEQTVNQTSDKEYTKEEIITMPIEGAVADENKSQESKRFLLKKEITFFQNLGLPQKIIYSVAFFAITFIICYVIAQGMNSQLLLKKTWFVWVGFFILQAWLQNKIWSANSEIKLSLFYPSIFNLFSTIGSYTRQLKNQYVTSQGVTKNLQVIEQTIHKRRPDKTLIGGIVFSLAGVGLIFMVIIFIISDNRSTEETNKNLVVESNPISKQPLKHDETKHVNTANELLLAMGLPGDSKVFSFKDENNLAGVKLNIKYPNSMHFFPGDKKYNIAVFSILNQDSLNFLCAVYLVKEKQIGKAITVVNLKQIMLSTLSHLSTNFQFLNDTGELSIASLHSVYADCFFESTDASQTTRQICRIYNYYYKGGEGNIQFYLNSRKLNKQQLQEAFNDYKPVISEMVSSIQLYN